MYKIAKPAQRILALNKLLESNPQQAHLFNERAAEYYRLWNYERAVADYSSSLALQPDDASVLHLRGVAYEQLRQFDHARKDYQRAVAIDPQLPNVYINRGVTFGSSGQFRQSITSLTEAIRLAPNNPDGYFNRGTSHFQIDDLERAIEDFSVVIQLSPGDQAAYYWRGISNERAGRRDAAIADYRQFLELSQEPKARQEIEQKLRQWNAGKPDSVRSRNAVPEDRQKTNQIPAAPPDPEIDLYGLIVALGEQALHSTWFGSGVECYGEKAEELYDLTDQNKPIEGRRFLHLASGIRQTIQGDFQAFEPGGTSPWLFIRAWDGSGFYIETNDPTSKELLKTHFQSMEEVEGASPPYEALFLPSKGPKHM
jgi:Flp pilus assembly protein TadD